MACVEHDNEDFFYKFGLALLALCKEQYDGSICIPGHSCIPKALYWYRKAAARLDAEASKIEECNEMESIVKSFCANCNKKEDELSEKLKACGLCKATYYCGKECQTNHWRAGH